MRTSRKLALLAVSAAAAFSVLVPAMASADTYSPGQAGGNFATGAGGWTNNTRTTGVCVPAVTCPIVSYSAPATGGSGGGSDGFIRTSVLSIGVAATTSNADWISPGFVYNGNGGGTPTSVLFDMFRQADVAGLVGVGVPAEYSVSLHDANTNQNINVVAPTSQNGAPSWTAISSAGINPALLTIGHTYQVVITSTYGPGGVAALLVMGDSDYDGVKLTTAGGSGAGGNPYGNPYGALSSLQQCLANAKKKLKKSKLKGKKKKKLKKKLVKRCNSKFKKKKKKKKKKK